jgi:eukaryotic-like serine/threonine-protein kinase
MGELETRLTHAVGTRYRLERELGRGGMAVVYLAEDLRHRRRVALKVLHPELAQAIGAERFLREIETAAQLTHPNILPLYDSGDADGLLFYVAPFIEGASVRERLARERQLPIDDALRLAREVADALAHAHAHGVVHRDIKPENILLQAGHAIVSDFGIARAVGAAGGDRLTATGLAIGTPAYMSPEQASGERDVDARSDIYSLGCVLYEMLAGEPPYTGPTTQAILARKAVAPIPSLHVVRETVPAAVQAIVERALAKAPADRFGTAAQLAQALERAGSGSLTSAPSHAHTPSTASTARRRMPWLVTAAAGTVAVIIAGIVLLRPPRVAAPPPPSYTQITNFAESATSPALSPDGRMLAFIVGESTFYGPGQIYVKLLPDGEPVQLTRDSLYKMGPRFTPDGSHITYTTLSGVGWDTWIVPALGGPPRLLLPNAEGLTWFTNASGEPQVLFSEMTGRDVQMAIVAATERRTQQRTVYMPPETGMAHRSYLSPDRNWVLIAGEMDYHSWISCRVVPFDGSSPGRAVGPIPSQCTDAAWSPDGRYLYFSADAGNGFHVWRQRFPDGAPEQVTFGVTEEEGIEFAPDGRSFITSIGTRQSTIWVRDANGERQITTEGYGMYPTLSSDGRKVFYLLREGGARSYVSGGLWVADLDSGERMRLLPGFLMQTFAISPNDDHVAFVAANDTTRSPLWVAALDGRSPPRRLVRDDVLPQRVFFRGGEVTFTARSGGTHVIHRVKPDGSDLRQLLQAPNVEAVSADGQWIVVWGQELVDLRAHPVDGGTPVAICKGCGLTPSFERGPWPPAVSWSGDGRFLYLDPYGVPYAVPLRPGQALPALPAAGVQSEKEIAALPGARPLAHEHAFTGPDPSRYAFTRVTIQRNLYRVPVQ